eukprot:13257583-Alexandrium_andersonii.AAC.1
MPCCARRARACPHRLRCRRQGGQLAQDRGEPVHHCEHAGQRGRVRPLPPDPAHEPADVLCQAEEEHRELDDHPRRDRPVSTSWHREEGVARRPGAAKEASILQP